MENSYAGWKSASAGGRQLSLLRYPTMGLDDSVLPYVGQLLQLQPFYGWGWSGNPEEPDAPGQVAMRLVRLWSMDGERRGGVAQVEQPGHPFNGYWVVFSTRHVGTFNFTDKLGHYNIGISPQAPVDQNGWPSMVGASPHMVGFAEIAASVVD